MMPSVVKLSLGVCWPAAVDRVAAWLDRRERIDVLMEGLPAGLAGVERARCQHLVFGVVRHAGRLEAELGRLIAHPPRFVTRAVLFVAGFELIEAAGDAADAGRAARIVHHAVEQTKELASPAEARLVNAVGRKLAAALTAPVGDGAAAWAERWSHPEWLVRRWLAEFGPDATHALLEWNQQTAPVHARWRDPGRPPEWLVPTAWAGFYAVPTGRWGDLEPLLQSGAVYLQDPATRLAVELLAPQAGETVLDLCASPGGKSLLIADTMGEGRLVAWDLPTARIDRMEENLARARRVEIALVQGDLLADAAAQLRARGLPAAYSAVLIDVPCSNTGVMRHRVDVKWRLRESDFAQHARQQAGLLAAASRFVAPGGRLVYSTCSIDPVENERVVATFLARHVGWTLDAQSVALPWLAGHDGAAAFRLLPPPALSAR
jgi:16S rRNA (cytosine967-C5)-methyltransferase